MKLTNKQGLPQPLYDAVCNDPYRKIGDISSTEAIKAPRRRQLLIRHDDEIVEDAADRMYMLLGSSIHAILERAGVDLKDYIVEKRLTAKVFSWTVSGQPDLYAKREMILYDYKVTSVYSFLLGDKPEFTQQLNIYAFLFRENLGLDVKELKIVAILRDWMQSRAKQEPDYPQIPVMVVDIPLWPSRDAEAYIHERVKLHQDAEHMDDGSLEFCTPEERWERPTTFAVMKPGNKRARRVFDSKDKATAEAGAQEVVITRKGESVRCANYCKAAPYCSQYRDLVIAA